jgi:hypothetical protein
MTTRSTWRAHGALCGSLVLVAVAACGGGAGGAAPPQVGTGTAPTGSEAQPAPGTSGAAAPGGAPGTNPAASAASPSNPLSPTAPIEMKPVVASAMIDDLRALGLDAKSLPPIEKLEPRTLRGVMKLMAKSLGVKCNDCHQDGDFAAPTRRKKIAAHMWDEFAAKLALGGSGGADSPLFCDSCHQGRVQLLDRHDKKALSKWMDDQFVVKLDRHDGKSVECETCHVDMDMHFLAKWGQ